MTIKNVEMDFEFQNSIPSPPRSQQQMYAQACSSDGITISTWRNIWLNNIKANHKKYGPFKDRSAGSLFGKHAKKPVIVAGSGPSLSNVVEDLRNTKGIPIVSCLHNYHYFVDNEVPVDCYMSLDAGAVTIEEVSEGGKKTHAEYVESTKDKTLVAFTGSHPDLLASWKGDIKFFTCPIPDHSLIKEILEIEPFYQFVSTGGNVLGGCTYLAKAIMGANPVVFVGADFSFSYTKKFHAWDSKYDKDIGNCLRAQDVWGNKVLTWQSYFNFKTWFDWMACQIPGLYINCSQGGTLGAYPEGNIQQIQQMYLKDLVRMYSMYEDMKDQCLSPEKENNKILF